MSYMSSVDSMPYMHPYMQPMKPTRLRGGQDGGNAAIIAIVVVIIVILLVAIIMAACWSGCGSKTETIYVTGPNGQSMPVSVPRSKARLYGAGKGNSGVKGGKALKNLPPLNPHRKSGKTYELASEQEARDLLAHPHPAMLFVYMNGCGFCDKAKEYYNDQLAQEHPYVSLAKIDAAKCGELCKQHNITGFPSFLTNFTGPAPHVGYKSKQVMNQLLSTAAPKLAAMQQAAAGMRMSTAGGAVLELDNAADAMKHLESGDKAVLFVYAPWCGFCKKQKPVYDQLAAKHKNIKFLAINADAAGKPLTSKFNINGFPAFVVNFGHGASKKQPRVMSGYKDQAGFEQHILNA